MIKKVSDYITDFLVSNSITTCFMVTGGGAMHLDDSLGRNKDIKCIFNHHEQACAISAEGYFRYTGKLAAVCVTSGPGGTNALTGVMGAYLDSIPMFVISGQVKSETTIYSVPDLKLRQLGDQEFNIVGTVKTMTKYAVMITKPEEISYQLEKAFYLATHGRKGPVWLDIPLDIQASKIDTDKLVHFNSANEIFWTSYSVKETLIDLVITLVKKSVSPLIIAGSGIRLSDSYELFLKFVEKYKIPVVTAWNSNDLVEYDNDYYVGMPGTVGNRSGNFVIQNSDLIISLGSRLNIRTTGYNFHDFGKNAFKILVDIDPLELEKPTVNAELKICCDLNCFFKSILNKDYQVPNKHEKWRIWCKNLLLRYPVVKCNENKEKGNINPYQFVDKLFSLLTPKDRIICGNGSACVITFQAAKIKKGQRMFTNSGCASMGYGLPASIGVSISDNSYRTICIEGDGSIMMNLQELSTIKCNNLNIKIFIINNGGYLSIRQTQNNLFNSFYVGSSLETGLSFPNFKKLSEAFDLSYFKIDSVNKLDNIIHSVLESLGPCICEVIVDSEQNFEPKTSSKVLFNGQIISAPLDDMFPFLPREEYESIGYKND